MTLLALRTFIESDLDDAPLQVILSAADEDITTAIGAETTMIEEREMEGQSILWLERPCSSMTSITLLDKEGTVTTLATNDYRIHPNQMRITRLITGTNPDSGWHDTVTLTYTPGDTNKRQRAIIALVEIELDFRHGKKSEDIGDHRMTQEDYDVARARIISQASSR